jgi:hypothetical protein
VIEQVYWDHRIWPRENAGGKPALAEVLSEAALRAKVQDYLEKSSALETVWQWPVSAEQLQAELDRIARSTRDATMLRELFSALRNDPTLIAETLVRQTLVERRVRELYAGDGRIHGDLRRKAEAALSSCINAESLKRVGKFYRETTWKLRDERGKAADSVNGDSSILLDPEEWTDQVEHLERAFGRSTEPLPIGTISGVEETTEAFVATSVLAQRAEEIKTATYVWLKVPFDVWWVDRHTSFEPRGVGVSKSFSLPAVVVNGCTPDSWTASVIPVARRYHSAVWTGAEMIVWGGFNKDAYPDLNSGARYDPATDSWSSTSVGNGVPHGRAYHSAVWTGTEMIIWGGEQWDHGPNGPVYVNTGGRYNPLTDSWAATSTGTNVPDVRIRHAAFWTGSEMIIWGGRVPTPSGVYTLLNTGGRYNPTTDSWTATSMGTGVPSVRQDPSAVWTGTEMIIWGGATINSTFNTGSRYNPSSDTWTATPMGANVPSARYMHSAVWTGDEMIVWGGYNNTGFLNTGGRLNLNTGNWLPTSLGANVPSKRSEHTALWTGTEMLIWGGTDNAWLKTGGRYNPSTDTWMATSTGANSPIGRFSHTGIWTGSEMIVWGGSANVFEHVTSTGGRYNPTTDTWASTSTGGIPPAARHQHTAVWTGTEMIVWGGNDGSIDMNSGGRYNAVTDTWVPTSMGAGVPDVRSLHTAVWTGKEMIVWGGYSGIFGTRVYPTIGGRFNPASNTWTATSTVGIPGVRAFHTAVWTGREMIAWGGLGPAGALDTGGRYDPATDSWTGTSVAGAVPAARYYHVAAWTGSQMIVWGGISQAYLNTGGRYDPSTDGWTATAMTPDVPSGRYGHTGIWTGREMIVWGGGNTSYGLNTGGRYDPISDTWSPTFAKPSNPSGAIYHTAIWTGSEMIAWGGDPSLNGGTRYDPSLDTWTPTSTAFPDGRRFHSAVWTGTEMVVWGGDQSYQAYPNSIGSYCAAACVTPSVFYQDHDGDGYGDSTVWLQACATPVGYSSDSNDCNDFNPSIRPNALEICNGIDDNCNRMIDEIGFVEDSEDDSVHDLCDNCRFVYNPSQSDFDHDGVGDACDLNDLLIYVSSPNDNVSIKWQHESGYTSWNLYTGDLATLKSSGVYTQVPGSNPLASRQCALSDVTTPDSIVPDPGKVEYSLVTGVTGSVESSLGQNSAGGERANSNPCP